MDKDAGKKSEQRSRSSSGTDRGRLDPEAGGGSPEWEQLVRATPTMAAVGGAGMCGWEIRHPTRLVRLVPLTAGLLGRCPVSAYSPGCWRSPHAHGSSEHVCTSQDGLPQHGSHLWLHACPDRPAAFRIYRTSPPLAPGFRFTRKTISKIL